MNNVTRLARAAIRYPLEASVVFWWDDENGIHQREEGRGRDASDRGAFVFSACCPPVGTGVGLRISIEGFPDESGDLQIEVAGRVLRVEQPRAPTEKSGFAVLLSAVTVRESEVGKCFSAEDICRYMEK